MDQCIISLNDISNIKDNTINISNNIFWENNKIIFRGKNNILYIEEGAKLKNCTIKFLGDNSIVYISESNRYTQINSNIFHDSALYLGKNNSFNGQAILSLSERKHIIIGNDNMFSFNINIRLADPHLIYSIDTHERINLSESVIIGDHVWIGESVKILKGSCIGSGSILGSNAIVTKKIFSNVSAAGIPAKVIKERVFWTRPCVHAYKIEQTRNSMINRSDEFIYKKTNNLDIFNYIDSKLDEAKSSVEKLEVLLWISKNNDKNRFFIGK